MQSTLTPLLEKFTDRPAAIRDELRTYAECDGPGFIDEAASVIMAGCDVDISRYLVHLLVKTASVMTYLADCASCSTERAAAIAKALCEAGAPLDTLLDEKLAAHVGAAGRGDTVIRLLDIASAIGSSTRVLPWRAQLMTHSDPRVRSKAARAIASGSKSPAWVASVLMEGDFRVQANAVEGLWDVDDKNVSPLMIIAARSPNSRVAANGLVGLYRHGSLDSIASLFKMAGNAEAAHRASAIWAMGATKDPRFLPYLSRQFEKAEGRDKQRILRALSSIRRRQKEFEQAGSLRFSVLDRGVSPDGSRRVTFTLTSPTQALPDLGPLNFAIWEQDQLVFDYSTRLVPAPPLMAFAVVLPRFSSKADPYACAVEQSLNTIIELKRKGDLWCFERYRMPDPNETAGESSSQELEATDDIRLALHLKQHRGLLQDVQFIRKVAADPGQRQRAATHTAAAIDKALTMLDRVSGVRHLFVFFDPDDTQERGIDQLAKALRGESVIIHGYAPATGEDNKVLQALCESAGNGSMFEQAQLDALPELVRSSYVHLMTRYEITYRPPEGASNPSLCTILVSCPQGSIRQSIDLSNR